MRFFLRSLFQRITGKGKSSLCTPDKMQITASYGNQEEPENFFDKDLTFEITSEKTARFLKCGHNGPNSGVITVYGHPLILEETKKEERDTMCLECTTRRLKEHSIRCSLCGYGIISGNSVALYHKNSGSISLQHATFVNDSAIGCMRWKCCPSYGFFASHWTAKGFRPAFDGGSSIAQEAFRTGKPVSVDLK
jgi:hypothetical protein